ncbi:MAG TPA: acyl carrier protein, partial [Pseudonocardiaceae bacterium]|nr:acyl carrier protein [Pseudonocardiaceae bacterium]
LADELPELGEDTRLRDDLGLESASVLELLMIIEDTAGITVDATEFDFDHLRSIRTFADYVESRQALATLDGA